MKNSVAQQLLAGSRNVDRMEKEIIELISMALGFAKKAVPHMQGDIVTRDFRLNSETCSWTLNFYFKDGICSKSNFIDFGVVCGDNRTNFIILRFDEGLKYINKEKLIAAYNDLQSFIDCVMHAFPGIEKNWKYLIDASNI